MEAVDCHPSSVLCLGNGKELTVDLWRMIFQKLPVDSLARASCVCRLWHCVAGDPMVLTNRFKEAWKLAQVVGRPLSTSFWRDASLGRFAISHVVKRWDTVAGLAVKYRVHVMEIKRLNNMMSDHGIHTRDRILIPVSRPEIVEGRTCYIEVDPYAKREVAVLYSSEDEVPKQRRILNGADEERLKAGVLDSLKRSLHLDDATVHYYLSMAGGDIKTAFAEYKEDLRWERENTLTCVSIL